MGFVFRRRMALLTVCILVCGLLSDLMPFGNERAYAGTGGEIYTVAGGEYGDYGDEVPAVDAELSNLSAVAVDSGGNLYIADTGNNKIRKITAATLQISTVAGSGNYGYSGDEGSALSAEMRYPSGVAADGEGNLYIADKYNNRIRKVDANGIISTIVGTGENDYSGDNGPAADAALSSPGGVATDGNGNLYIADTGNSRIRKVDADGTITTVAGSSDYGTFSGDGGPAVDADLYRPSAVAIDGDGNLYIADTDNNRIRKVDTNGIISTVAGSSSADGYSGDGGLAVNAQLNGPEGIAVDDSGNLYIADTDNNRIRKVTPNGRILTIAGTGTSGYSGDGGSGIAAQLDGPTGVAMDAGGNLYIADKYNYALRKQVPYIPSSDASLSNIALSSGTLSPTFVSGTTEYTASVVNGVSSIRVTPTTADSFMTVEVNGEEVLSGTPSGDINLDVGFNPIALAVKAEDGTTTKTYTIIIERLRSGNANLSQLTLSDGTLSPAFASGTTSYAANASRSEITVTPTLADPLAAVKVNGETVTSGTVSRSIPLGVGNTAIAVVVTAQNGTTKTYTIDVERAISMNADLSGLALSSGTLSPSFGAGTTGYAANVGNSVDSLTVTPTTADRTATVTVNGTEATSGSASLPLPLIVGSNTISLRVTAESGATKDYTVTVTRAESSNADLSDLTLSGGPLTPSFLPGTFTSSVGFSVTGVTVTPTVSDTLYAAAEVSLYDGNGALVDGPLPVPSGTASPSLPLGVGSNTITVLVTAQDGTTRTYAVTVTRGASANADLSNLTLSSGPLTPAFAGTYAASVSYPVDSVTVTSTLSDADNASATASVYDDNGTRASGPHALTSGAASPPLPLNVGENVIAILVTAQDGSTKTYQVAITRKAPDPAPPNTGGGGTAPIDTVGAAPVVNEPVAAKAVIDLNGLALDPAGIDTRKPFVALEATTTDGVAVVGIPASVLSGFADRNADFYLEIGTPYGSYQVPANLASLIPELPDLLANNKLQAGDVSFRITLTDKTGDNDLQAAIANALPNGKVLGTIVDFRIDIVNSKSGSTIGTAEQFGKALTRRIALPNNPAGLPSLWGAFRYREETGKLEFVPATKLKQNGMWYAAIHSYTNSVYVAMANAASFADVEKHWSKSAVEFAAAKGLVEGVGGGQFAPERTVTRAEFAAMLVRALGRSVSAGSVTPYNDVAPDAWYAAAVVAAKELGLLDFASGNSFRPDQPLAREEMASMLAAMIARSDAPIAKGWVSLDRYEDIGSANDSYLGDIRLMVKLQIMTGTDEDTFSPKGVTTRAQAAVVLIRTLYQLGMIE